MSLVRITRRRRGAQVLESILVISALAIVLAALVQFGAIAAVQQSVESAADEAARETAKVISPFSDATIGPVAIEVVSEVLSAHSLTVIGAAPGAPNGTGVRVIVEDGDGAASVSVGDTTLSPSNPAPAGSPAPGEVRATVIVSFDPSAPNPDPLPNILTTFGLDFAGKQIEASSIAKKE